jgi:beta-N-acetylhexosaminidase
VSEEPLLRLADGCILPGFAGQRAPEWVLRRLEAGLGGVVLFARNVGQPAQVAELCAELRAVRPEVLIGIDEEGGDVTRLEAATGSSYPGNLALGAADDTELTRRVAAAIGAELAAAGVNIDLAPVADVNSNPLNPSIGVRSFGAAPALVSRHTTAFVTGLQSRGVAACVKHFPGHGDTAVDSHVDVPVVPDDPRALETALMPFRAAVAAGAEAMMTAHVRVPAWGHEIATLSPRIVTGLLREQLGYRGLVVTDGLDMGAIVVTVGMAEAAVLAIAAGADALCLGGFEAGEDLATLVRDALVRAVREGRLAEERLAEAAGRVAATARTANARGASTPPAAPDRAAGLEAARRAVRAEGEVAVGAAPVVVELRPAPSVAAGPMPWGLAGPLRERGAAVTALSFDTPPDVPAIAAAAHGRSLVVVVRDLHCHEWHARTVEAVLEGRPDAVVVEMGLPALRPAAARNYVVTHGAARVCAVAAVELLGTWAEPKEAKTS